MPLALWLSFDGGRFNLVQAWRLAIATALILTLGYFLHLTASHKISQADTTQKFVNLQAQIAPQVVGQTGVALMAITLALAFGCINRFVDRIDHLGDLDALHVAGQLVATARATNAGDQIATTQFGKKLFEVGQEMPWRSEISARDTGPCCACNARSSMAVTAYRPFVVSRMDNYHGVQNGASMQFPSI